MGICRFVNKENNLLSHVSGCKCVLVYKGGRMIPFYSNFPFRHIYVTESIFSSDKKEQRYI